MGSPTGYRVSFMSRASQPANPWVGTTYIPDNPRMDTPPAWFLAQIHDYDAALVVFPSRYRPYAYVIARRSRLGRRGLTGNAIADTITQPDTVMVMKHGCVPVCYMYKHGPVWNADTVLRSLRARDLWAHGGADKVADQLEADELAEEKKRADAKREELWHLSGDAWRSYKARTGQSVINTGGRSQDGAAKSNSSSRSTATGGSVSLS